MCSHRIEGVLIGYSLYSLGDKGTGGVVLSETLPRELVRPSVRGRCPLLVCVCVRVCRVFVTVSATASSLFVLHTHIHIHIHIHTHTGSKCIRRGCHGA